MKASLPTQGEGNVRSREKLASKTVPPNTANVNNSHEEKGVPNREHQTQLHSRQRTGQPDLPQKVRNPFVVSSKDPLVNSAFNAWAGPSRAQSKGVVKGLPVLEAYFGDTHFTPEYNLRLFVDQGHNRLCVKSVKGSPKFQSVEMLQAAINRCEMTDSERIEDYLILKISTEPVVGRRRVVTTQPVIPGYRGGNDHLPDVLIRLDCRHEDWSKKVYDSIRTWLGREGRKMHRISFSNMNAVWTSHLNCLPKNVEEPDPESSGPEYQEPIVPIRRAVPQTRKRKRSSTATPDPPDEHSMGMAAFDDEELQPIKQVFETDTSLRRRVAAPSAVTPDDSEQGRGSSNQVSTASKREFKRLRRATSHDRSDTPESRKSNEQPDETEVEEDLFANSQNLQLRRTESVAPSGPLSQENQRVSVDQPIKTEQPEQDMVDVQSTTRGTELPRRLLRALGSLDEESIGALTTLVEKINSSKAQAEEWRTKFEQLEKSRQREEESMQAQEKEAEGASLECW